MQQQKHKGNFTECSSENSNANGKQCGNRNLAGNCTPTRNIATQALVIAAQHAAREAQWNSVEVQHAIQCSSVHLKHGDCRSVILDGTASQKRIVMHGPSRMLQHNREGIMLTHCLPRRCWRVDSDLKVYLQPELAFCIWSNRYMTDLVTMPSSVSPIERTDLHCLVIAQRVHVGTIANLIGFQIYASVCMETLPRSVGYLIYMTYAAHAHVSESAFSMRVIAHPSEAMVSGCSLLVHVMPQPA